SPDSEKLDMENWTDMGKVSKFLSVNIPKLIDMLKENKNMIIFISQIRDKINTGYMAKFLPKTGTSGGWALRFYASLRLEFKKSKMEKAAVKNYLGKIEKVSVASWIMAKVAKSKVSIPYRSGAFLFRFDEGIDNLYSMIKIAEYKKLIKR